MNKTTERSDRINECGVVRDLLPLYAEGLAGRDSIRLVETHIKNCEECRKEAVEIKKSAGIADSMKMYDIVPLDKMWKTVRKKRALAVSAALLILSAVFISVFVAMTNPIYLSCSEAEVSVAELEDGSVLLSFGSAASDFAVYECDAPDGGVYYTAEAWYTSLDRLRRDDGREKALQIYIAPDNFSSPTVYYVQNNGADDVFLCGEELTNGGIRTLPRLVLGYYFLIAVGVFVLTAVIFAIFMRLGRRDAASAAGKIAMLPLSYITAHLLIKGAETVSYSAERDFIYIIITASVIYAAVLITARIIKERRK